MLESLPKPPTLAPRPDDDSLAATMYRIADALRYPVDNRGRVYDCQFLMPILAFHLARAGAVIDPQRATIKARRLPTAPGMVDGAVEWVPIDAPDRIDDEFAGVTIDDLDTLSPAARAELIRRLGGHSLTPEPDPEIDDRPLWRVQTSIHFDDQEQI